MAGLSSSIGSHRDFENERARFSVGISHRAGLGSLAISQDRPAISVVVFEVCDPQQSVTSDTLVSFQHSIGSRVYGRTEVLNGPGCSVWRAVSRRLASDHSTTVCTGVGL